MGSYRPQEYLFENKFIEIDGVKISYIEEGSGETTVLFIHGLGGSLNNWDYNFGVFQENYHCLAIDLPGFGNSDRPDIPYSVSLHTDFVANFLSSKGIKKAVLVGNSMGGHTSAKTAIRYSELVERLVLVDASGADYKVPWILSFPLIYPQWTQRMIVRLARRFTTRPHEAFERGAMKLLGKYVVHGNKLALVYDMKEKNTEAFFKLMVRYSYDFIPSPEFPKYIRAVLRSGKSIPRTSLMGNLGKITAPTLIVWGREDGLVPLKYAHKFNEAIPGSRLAIISQAGHMPQIEAADHFNRVVMDFIEGVKK